MYSDMGDHWLCHRSTASHHRRVVLHDFLGLSVTMFQVAPFQAVRKGRSEPTHHASQEQGCNQQRPDHHAMARSRRFGGRLDRCQPHQFGPHSPQVGDDSEGDSAFAQGDDQMDADHDAEELAERHLQHAAHGGLDRHHRRSRGDPDQARDPCGQVLPPRRRPGRRPEQKTVGRPAKQARYHAQIQNVATQGKQPAVLEQQALNDEDRSHSDNAGRGSQQNGQENAATEVAAGTGHARQREVDHLRREHERAHHAHQGQPVVARRLPGTRAAIATMAATTASVTAATGTLSNSLAMCIASKGAIHVISVPPRRLSLSSESPARSWTRSSEPHLPSDPGALRLLATFLPAIFISGLPQARRLMRAGAGRSSAVLPVSVFLTSQDDMVPLHPTQIPFAERRAGAQLHTVEETGSRRRGQWTFARDFDIEVPLRIDGPKAGHAHPGSRHHGGPEMTVNLDELRQPWRVGRLTVVLRLG